MALGYAAIALVILAIFLPVAMVWQQRKQKATSTQKLSLITVIVIGVIIILSQLLQIVGIIPKLG